MADTAQHQYITTTQLGRLCDTVIRGTIFLLVFLVPLFFLPWTTETAELNKQLLLVVGAAVTGMAWLGKMMVERRCEYRRSIINILVVLLLAAYAVSAWFSESRYTSTSGDFGQEMHGLITMFAFVILYFVVINNFREVKSLKRLLFTMILSGSFVSIYALLQGIGVYIFPFNFSKTASFNTIGTASALGVYLSFIVTLCGGMLMAGHHTVGTGTKGILTKTFLALTALVSLFLIGVVDFLPVTLPLLLASAALIIFAFFHARSVKSVGGSVALPFVAFVLSTFLLFARLPIASSFPSEVMPSIASSAGIAIKTLRAHPFVGSGPGTFLFDYAKYRPVANNLSQFWNVRFDRSASHAITTLATTGFVGTLPWLLIALLLFFSAGYRFFNKTQEEMGHLLIGAFAAWFLLLVARLTYSSTITLEFIFWMTMAVLVATYRKEFFLVKFEHSSRAMMFVPLLFILGVVFTCTGMFVEGQRYAAEIAYAKGVRIDHMNGSPDETVKWLSRAVELNGQNDLFLRNLALAYLTKANAALAVTPNVVQKKDEKKEDYAVRVQQAKQDQLKEVSQSAAAAVNAAQSAVVLDENSVANWATLASVYQSLLGVTAGSDTFAIASYQKIFTLEPTNPATHTELGKVYLYQADQVKQSEQTMKDDTEKKDAEKKINDLFGKAMDEFTKAIALKSDYSPAHYNLALIYDRQGKLKDAIKKVESIVAYNNQDVSVGFQLALLYYRDGRKDDAVRLLESVVKLSPNYSNARWYLAGMYEEKGNIDGALAQVMKVLALNPNSDLAKQKLDALSKKKTPPAPLPLSLDHPAPSPNPPNGKK